MTTFQRRVKYLLALGIGGSIATAAIALILWPSEEAIKLARIRKSKKEEQAKYYYR